MGNNLEKLQNHGIDVRISDTAVIRRPELVRIGNHVSIDEFFVATTALDIGDHVHISPHVAVIGGKHGLLRMGNFTNLSVGCRVVCGSDKFNGAGLVFVPGIPEDMLDEKNIEPVVFEDFVNTGADVTILPGVIIPEGVVIGARSLVRKQDILEPWTIYAGNPLRKIKPREREYIIKYAKTILSNTKA